MDKIIIEKMRINTIIGIHPHERKKKQEVFVTLVLSTDIRMAALTDDLAHGVDYEAIKNRVFLYVEASGCYLLEKLTVDIASLVLMEFPAIDKILVRVDKPAALSQTQQVSVEIDRSREEC